MRKETLSITLAALMVLLIICDAGRAVASSRRGGTASAASLTPAMMGGTKEKTDLDTFTLNWDDTVRRIPVGNIDWQTRVPGFNILRSFTNTSNKRILFILNGNTGEAESFILNADGSLSPTGWWTALQPLPELRCTGADIFPGRSGPKLVTQDSLTGRVRIIPLNQDGSPNLKGMTVSELPDMQDKNLFQIFNHAVYGYQMIGADTWSGRAAVYGLNMSKIDDKDWTLGWTSMDHLYLDGRTYRLLYKAAGDPYKKPAETTDQIGRVQVQIVEANGNADQNLPDTQIDGNYSSARFVEIPDAEGGASKYGVLFYRRTTGEYLLYGFNTQTGLGQKIDHNQFVEPTLKETPPYVDLHTCVVGGKPLMAFVSADNMKPLGFAQANALAETIYDTIKDKTVGYQFILAQSGRIMHRRAYGKLKLDHVASSEINMTTHSQLETGSVSKVITALTVLKLADQGVIDLSAPISTYLAPDQFNPGSWAETTPVRNLLTHTSGVSSNACKLFKDDAKVDCAPFFALTPDQPCDPNAPGGFNCNRVYNGSNYRALRKIIEFVQTAAKQKSMTTSKDITDATHDLWANDIGLGEITCQRNPNAFYYGVCDDPMKQDCYSTSNNLLWQRIQQTNVDGKGWLPGCSSRHWYASSRELMAFLGAIRYRQILKNSPSMTEYLLRTDLNDLGGNPGSTAVAWDPPAPLSGGTVLGKGGNLPLPAANAAARAYIARLPYNCDVVVLLNTELTGTSALVNNTFQTLMP
jgi:hypothetical protein